MAFRAGPGVSVLFEREAPRDAREGPIADHGRTGPATPACSPRIGDYERRRELGDAGVEITHDQQWAGGPALVLLQGPGRQPARGRRRRYLAGVTGRFGRAGERTLSERELEPRPPRPAAAARARRLSPAEGAASGSAGSRRSTRRRCTSGCGPGSRASSAISCTRALERRTVVQGTSLRATIHLLSPGDWWTFAIATAKQRREDWLRNRRDAPTPAQMGATAQARARAARGSARRAQGAAGGGRPRAPGISGINAWIDLVRVPPSGTWERRRADLFARRRGLARPAAEAQRGEATVGAGAQLPDRLRPGDAGRDRRLGRAGPEGGARRSSGNSSCAASSPRTAPSWSISRAYRCPTRTRPRRRACSRSGTRRCSPTPAAPRSCPRSTGRRSSTPRRRSRCRPS